MRILGIDYGDARTGVAISDELGWTAQGLHTLHEHNPGAVADHIMQLIKEYLVDKIVVGLPRNMDGSEGFRGKATRGFVQALEQRTSLPIILWDERLSTVAASRSLSETNVRGKKRKAVIDTVAATYILQGYLDGMNS